MYAMKQISHMLTNSYKDVLKVTITINHVITKI